MTAKKATKPKAAQPARRTTRNRYNPPVYIKMLAEALGENNRLMRELIESVENFKFLYSYHKAFEPNSGETRRSQTPR